MLSGIRGRPPGPPAPVDAKSKPYVGMRPFTRGDQAVFFGRTGYILDLGEKLRSAESPRFLFFLGASGSGKSSLLHAGLIPSLESGELLPGEEWVVATTRPGSTPWSNLRSALRAVPRFQAHVELSPVSPESWLHEVATSGLGSQHGASRLLLVVDQFEELITHQPASSEALEDYRRKQGVPFLRNLVHAAEQAEGQVFVLAAGRADFLGRLAEFKELRRLADDHHRRVVLEALDEDNLREAIERPAVARGLQFEPGLVDALVEDFRVQPAGSLPFLQQALKKVAAKPEGTTLTVSAYTSGGRLRGAIHTHAQEKFGKLSTSDQTLARALFVDRVRLGVDGGPDTKRRLPLQHLPGGPDTQQLAMLLASEAGGRLLTLDDPTARTDATDRPLVEANQPSVSLSGAPTVELAHEALIQGWHEGLGKWLTADRDFIFWRERLRGLHEVWQRGKSTDDDLLRGPTLDEADRWLQQSANRLSRDERTFIERSIAASKRTQNRRLKLAVGFGVAMSVVAMTLLVTFDSARNAKAKATAGATAAQQALTRSFVRTIGTSENWTPSRDEEEALWELAELESANEPVRKAVLTNWLQTPDLVPRALAHDARGLHAAIGLHAARTSARTSWANGTATQLVQALENPQEKDSSRLWGLGQALAALAARIPSANKTLLAALSFEFYVEFPPPLEKGEAEPERRLTFAKTCALLATNAPANLVEVLKWPCFVGEAQKLVLTALENRTQQKFDGDVWNFVEQVDSLNLPGVNRQFLDLPAKRPKLEDAITELENLSRSTAKLPPTVPTR